MNSKKLTKEEWESLVRDASRSKGSRDAAFKTNFSALIKFVPVPIVIGAFASTLYIYRYGFEGLVSLFLSCVIGATLIATLSATFINTIKQFFEAM